MTALSELVCREKSLEANSTETVHLCLILLDLSTAFDGITIRSSSPPSQGWIASYLAGRSYQVTWRESVSAPQALPTGVPKVSVLGPLLFSLYTKSLSSVISSHNLSCHCYVDDAQPCKQSLDMVGQQPMLWFCLSVHCFKC